MSFVLTSETKACLIIANKVKKCNERNLSFGLTIEKIKPLIERNVCEYTGESFGNTVHVDKLSLERIDPTEGYIDSNVAVVISWVNRLKGATLDLFLHNEQLTSEQKLKILNKVVYRLQKKVKMEKEQQKQNLEQQELSKKKREKLETMVRFSRATSAIVSAARRQSK